MNVSESKPWLELAASADQGWLVKLASWYESDWQRVIETSQVEGNDNAPYPDRPSVDALIDQLPAERRDLAISTLRSIDQFYRETVRSRAFEEKRTVISSADRKLVGDAIVGSEYATEVSGPSPRQHEMPTIDSIPVEPSGGDVTVDSELPPIEMETLDSNDVRRASPTDGEPDATVDFSVGSMPIGGGARIVHSGKSSKTGKPTEQVSLPRGATVGDYQIEKVLGKGGMGVVYLARQQKLDRMVALKMILGGDGMRQSLLDRFDAEAKAIARFQHENIVRIFETGTHDGMPYFSLEFIEGETLSEQLREGPMSPQRSATILESVARALHYAHQRNIIHRDIKPANVLLTDDDVPKVSDFGLAREIERDQTLSQDGSVVGTPGYMAPEQARASSNVGPAADVWGMGAMLYAMLTGRAPFVGSNPGESVMMLLREEPVPPSKMRMKVPPDLETICLKCLEKDISRRYESAESLADDLGRFLRNEPILARPISRTERLTRWCKRNPKFASLTGLAAALALALSVGGPLAAGTIYQQKAVVQEANQNLEETNSKLAQSEEQERAARKLAEEKEASAIESERLATTAQKAAVVAKESAQRNAESAQAGYKQAVDALKSLVFGVIRKLEDRPGMADVREELLVTARQGLERLDSTASDPTQNNIIAAGTLRRLGDANLQTGRAEAARQCYQRCLEVVTELDKKGELPGRFHNLSTSHDLLGQSLKKLGRLSEAKEQLIIALDLRRRWLAENPGDDGVRQNVAATLGGLAFVEMDLGDLEAAEKLFDESIDIRREGAKANLFSLGPQLELLGAKWSLEKLRFRQGDVATAIEKMIPISDQLDELATTNPYQLAPAWNAGLAKNDLALWNLYSGNVDAAAKSAQAAVDRLREIRDTETNNLRLDESLAAALYLSAICIDDASRNDRLKECIEIRRRQMAVDLEVDLPKVMLAATLARAGEADEAEKLLANLPTPDTAHTQWWRSVAVANAALAEASQSQLAIDRGIDAIQAGIAAEQLPDVIVRLDPELKPLRNSERWESVR